MLHDQPLEASFCIQMAMDSSPRFMPTLVEVYVTVLYLVMTRVYTGSALSLFHKSNVSHHHSLNLSSNSAIFIVSFRVNITFYATFGTFFQLYPQI